MEEDYDPTPSVAETLLVRVIAQELLELADFTNDVSLVHKVNSEAVQILSEIKKVLDDPELDDSECFYRIDSIVDIFYQAGISTQRHEECG